MYQIYGPDIQLFGISAYQMLQPDIRCPAKYAFFFKTWRMTLINSSLYWKSSASQKETVSREKIIAGIMSSLVADLDIKTENRFPFRGILP